jgi:hypothetical protein
VLEYGSGVQVNRPVFALIDEPGGAPEPRLKVIASPSGSLATAWTDSGCPSFTVWLAIGWSTGGWFTGGEGGLDDETASIW